MKYFGTDGIRHKAKLFFENDLAYKVALAIAELDNEEKTICIARDTRVSGEDIRDELIKGFTLKNCKVIDFGVVPTPALAYMTVKFNANFGIMISASHNPPEYNGIKIFNKSGYKLTEKEEEFIEERIDSYDIKEKNNEMKSEAINGKEIFIDYLVKRVNFSLEGYKIKIDCGYGAGSHLAKEVFEKLGARVDSICDGYNGAMINVDCGSTNIDNLKMNKDYDIGFSFDGDVDRVIAVDNENHVIDGDAFLYIIGMALDKKGLLKNRFVVGTTMTNMSLEKELKKNNIVLVRTDVGDKYIQQSMIKNNYIIGGEQSGHIILDGLVKTGDGIYAACVLLKSLKEIGMMVSDVNKKYIPFPQKIVNVMTENKECIKAKEVQDALKEGEKMLDGNGRVVLRPSGTEPKIRIMVEASDEKYIDPVCNLIKEAINKVN